jgi:hypothetical protein
MSKFSLLLAFGLQACLVSMLDAKKNIRQDVKTCTASNDKKIETYFRGGEVVSKSLSLFFAVASVVLMLATAFSINTSGWLALMFGLLTLAMIATGFVVKARQTRKSSNS